MNDKAKCILTETETTPLALFMVATWLWEKKGGRFTLTGETPNFKLFDFLVEHPRESYPSIPTFEAFEAFVAKHDHVLSRPGTHVRAWYDGFFHLQVNTTVVGERSARAAARDVGSTRVFHPLSGKTLVVA